MYALDFETIKQVMQEHRKTGILSAEVPAGSTRLRGSCRIEIALESGKIVMCVLTTSNGVRLTGKEALQELTRLGQVRWTFTPKQEVATQQDYTASSATRAEESILLPQHTVQLEQAQMRTWSRTQRAVFALADGTKSIARIAEILSTSPDLVSVALRDLQAMGVITMMRQKGKEHL